MTYKIVVGYAGSNPESRVVDSGVVARADGDDRAVGPTERSGDRMVELLHEGTVGAAVVREHTVADPASVDECDQLVDARRHRMELSQLDVRVQVWIVRDRRSTSGHDPVLRSR